MTSVLLIDDDKELAGLLKDYLEMEGLAVALAHDGERVLGKIVEARAEIVVLDIMMPKIDGLEVLRRIRTESPIPVLMLTARGDEQDRIRGLDLGADDYMAKPCSPGELAARIRAILRRASVRRPAEPFDSGPLCMDSSRRVALWRGEPVLMTGMEFNILEVLAEHSGRPVSRAELSELALGRPLAPYDRAIDVHVSAIRRKLGTLSDGRSPIQNLRGVGYQLLSE